MAEQTGARSPLALVGDRLAEVGSATGGALSIAEVPFLAQINVRLDPKGSAADPVTAALGVALPTAPGITRSGELSVVWLGPDEWLIIGPPGTEGELTSRLRSSAGAAHVSVVDVSAQRTTLLVAGPRARDLLALGCALDLHPRSFGEGSCAQTMLAQAPIILVGRDLRPPAFWVLVRASFAAYLADWLIDASIGFSADPQ